MQNNIYEGLFFADRNTKKIYGKSKEIIGTKISELKDQYKDYNPKFSNIKTDSLGRFFVEFSYQKNEKGKEEIIGNKIKQSYNKGKEVVTKISNAIPRQGELIAPSELSLTRKQNAFKKDHPDVKFGNKEETESGWKIKYAAKPIQKQVSSQDRINNIQRALSKLSDDQLKHIEDFIK